MRLPCEHQRPLLALLALLGSPACSSTAGETPERRATEAILRAAEVARESCAIEFTERVVDHDRSRARAIGGATLNGAGRRRPEEPPYLSELREREAREQVEKWIAVVLAFGYAVAVSLTEPRWRGHAASWLLGCIPALAAALLLVNHFYEPASEGGLKGFFLLVHFAVWTPVAVGGALLSTWLVTRLLRVSPVIWSAAMTLLLTALLLGGSS